MKTRRFPKLGTEVSEIGFGAWAIGGTWGEVSEEDARGALHAALDAGVTFLDTADVYGDGRSEKIIGAVLKERGETPVVATKLGRRLNPHEADGYTAEAMEAFLDRSLGNLGMERVDLVQLHCPPTEVYYRPEVFDALERFVEKGKLRSWGVSVEKVEEGLKAIEYPGCAAVQIIYNIFRQRPADLFLRRAKEKEVAVITRVPLASGLLTGKMSRESTFAEDDHRSFNRDGAAFDKGETFAGVPFDTALEAVEELRGILPGDVPMAQAALRWILMNDGVTVAIPGAKTADQARSNAAASDVDALPLETMERIRDLYEAKIAPHVHQLW